MPTITPRRWKDRRTWRVQVRVAGRTPESKTFDTRAEALAWGLARERAVRRGSSSERHTFGDAMARYADEVSPKHRSMRHERIRLASLGKLPIASIRMRDLTPDDFARLRDHEFGHLAPGSIRRALGLINLVLESARRDWGWIEVNVLRDVRKPPSPPSRVRRVSDEELRRLRMALDWPADVPPAGVSQKIALAFCFAIETGMRKGEILGLHWPEVDLRLRTAMLPLTKNGTARSVPLTGRAVELLRLLPRSGDVCFGLISLSVDVLFRRARIRAGIEDMHFHDSRHEATHRLAERLEVQDLARVLGHRDLRSLMIYYHPTAAQLAERLAETEPRTRKLA